MRFLILLLLIPFIAAAEDTTINASLKTFTTADSYASDSIVGIVNDKDILVDANINVRIMIESKPAEKLKFVLHYENSFSKGESISAVDALRNRSIIADDLVTETPKDSDQLFDLTSEYSDDNGQTAYQRLDRLYVRYDSSRLYVSAGRQAAYWGRGKVFSVMDIINPYDPLDVLRERKDGRDMVTAQWKCCSFGDLSATAAIGRKPETSNVDQEYSSGIVRYKKVVAGGSIYFLGGSHEEKELGLLAFEGKSENTSFNTEFMAVNGVEKDYVTALINAEYAWLTFNHDTKGFIEFYTNTLGAGTQEQTEGNSELMSLFDRNDLYTRDKYYSAVGISSRPSDRIKLYAQIVVNLRDYSYMLQPKFQWDYSSMFKVVFGLDIPSGGTETEFGGYYDEDSEKTIDKPTRVYCQVALNF